jgi:hypothetical protein
MKPLYEVCLISIKEQVGEKASTVCTHRLSVEKHVHQKLEIKDITDTERSASYLDLHLEIDTEGRLRTKPYDKRDVFIFPIVNFLFICKSPNLELFSEITSSI